MKFCSTLLLFYFIVIFFVHFDYLHLTLLFVVHFNYLHLALLLVSNLIYT